MRLQNSVGLYISGALYGYVLLVKQDKRQSDEQLHAQLTTARQEIQSGKSRVRSTLCAHCVTTQHAFDACSHACPQLGNNTRGMEPDVRGVCQSRIHSSRMEGLFCSHALASAQG